MHRPPLSLRQAFKASRSSRRLCCNSIRDTCQPPAHGNCRIVTPARTWVTGSQLTHSWKMNDPRMRCASNRAQRVNPARCKSAPAIQCECLQARMSDACRPHALLAGVLNKRMLPSRLRQACMHHKDECPASPCVQKGWYLANTPATRQPGPAVTASQSLMPRCQVMAGSTFSPHSP